MHSRNLHKYPPQAGIHHRNFGRDSIEPEAREWQRGFDSDDSEVCRMDRDKPPWQCRDQVGPGNGSEREHKIRNRQCNAP